MMFVRYLWLFLFVFSGCSVADTKTVDALTRTLPECNNAKDYDSSDCDAAILRESKVSEQKLTYDKRVTPTEIGDVLLIDRQPELSVGLNYVVSNQDKKKESKIGLEVIHSNNTEMFIVDSPEACNDKNQIDVLDNNNKSILLERICNSYNKSKFSSEISYYLYDKSIHSLYFLHHLRGADFVKNPQLKFNTQGFYSFQSMELDSNKKNTVVFYDFSVGGSKFNNISCNKSWDNKCLITQIDGPLLQDQYQSIPSNDRSFLKDISKQAKPPADNLNGEFNVPKFDKLIKNSHWQVLEANGSCGFFVKYSGTSELSKAITLSECDNVINTSYQLLSNNVLFANWQSERGGKAYLVSPNSKGFALLELKYMSGDEDSLSAKVNGNAIYLSSSTDKIEVLRASNAELKIVKRASKIK